MQSIREIKAELVLVSNALTPARQTTLLAGEKLQHFEDLCRQMLAFYPNQEFAAETVDGYLLELERIAVRHGLDALERAFIELRGKPGQKFFPHPSEVADVIEAMEERAREQSAQRARLERRQHEIEAFWRKAPDHMALAEIDEVELLRRFPSYRGTKPASLQSERPNVVPIRDRKTAAAGDGNEAA